MGSYQEEIIVLFASMVLGYGFYFAILKVMPLLEKREINKQKKAVLREAKKQSESIKTQSSVQFDEEKAILLEDLDESIKQEKLELQEEYELLNDQADGMTLEEQRVAKKESSMEEKEKAIALLDSLINEKKQLVIEQQKLLSIKLEEKADVDSQKISANLMRQIVDKRKLDCQKVIKSLDEELNSSARKRAQRLLERSLARYNPEFVWPKSVNVIDLPDEKTFEDLNGPHSYLIDNLKEISGVSIKIIESGKAENPHRFVKVAGGFGIYREAAWEVLNQLLILPTHQWKRGETLYEKQKKALESEAVLLGKKAIDQLHLQNIHPEIQKLVGALNWRTSYRQNQWYHTVEVATLAGILATELGVDPDHAKRVGLLHDIGKAIDYRIEGSHAVISGDYADRFGETRLICDTVMSHHSDLLVESPLAFVLRAADTLSGARPGARVNLEEGYQIRLDSISEAIRSFSGINDFAIMNGGREVHIQVNYKRVNENHVATLTKDIAKKIEEDVAFPGQIKVLVTRTYESVSVA